MKLYKFVYKNDYSALKKFFFSSTQILELCNVISVDWRKLANTSPFYNIAAAYTKPVGYLTADLVDFLVTQFNMFFFIVIKGYFEKTLKQGHSLIIGANF